MMSDVPLIPSTEVIRERRCCRTYVTVIHLRFFWKVSLRHASMFKWEQCLSLVSNYFLIFLVYLYISFFLSLFIQSVCR
jgi:hypothetical protein